MHVMDHVQSSYIQMCQPVKHGVIFIHNFIIIQIFGCDRLIFRCYLISCLLIYTAVDRIQQTFCQVCSCSEELDLFTCLSSRYTAADRIVIAPYRTHNIIVLILDRACCNRDMCCIFFECLRQTFGIQNGQVRFR